VAPAAAADRGRGAEPGAAPVPDRRGSLFRRTWINSWYVPADAPERVSLLGHLQFIRKYDLGLPFRVMREKKRRLIGQ
jgi:hypothetical protein